MTNITIEQYIKVSEKDHEAFALIAKNKADVDNFVQKLSDFEYREVVDSKQAREYLTNQQKIFGIVTPENCQFFYTLAKDFSAGAIQFFDFENNKVEWMQPDKKSAVCLIILQDEIIKINNQGFDFNNVCISVLNQ